ncbi:putative membrane protein [Fictibacillus solisalsi]|uniref:Putative membrane protein n=1 Tax=Fictibacillus solisalsi TaxID=459525 RepID=A0A1G9TIE2_9BACL|nr:YhgE/Pip domain-containing protein [Fictibacillus solisalsi]SDM47318.1 putative membrane protein [Fictibacillus solisalsi]
MKKAFNVFRTDWEEVLRIPSAALLIMGLIFLPSVYAWVNIKAMWDPYENTEGIKIAISNDDRGAMFQDKNINIGNEVVQNLKNNHKLGWTFVTKEKAHNGVVMGDYYASLYIPKDFSKKIASIASQSPEKPVIDYAVNEKINAVSPKITQSGVSTIINQVSDSFTRNVGKVIFSKFNEAGITLERNLPTIQSFEQKLFALEKELPKINRMSKRIILLDEKLALLHKRTVSLNLQKLSSDFEKVSSLLTQTEKAVPQIQQVLDQATAIDNRLSILPSIEQTAVSLDSTLLELQSMTDQAIQKAREAQKASPGLSYPTEQLTTIKNDLNNLRVLTEKNRRTLGEQNGNLTSLQDLMVYYREDWPAAKKNISEASARLKRDSPEIKKDLTLAAAAMKRDIPKMEKAIHRAASLAENDLPQMEKSIIETANKIREFKRNNNLNDVIQALKNNPGKESDFLASPIVLKEHKIFPIPNYGSAMTPFYTVLALWVGGMLLISSLKAGRTVSEEGQLGMALFWGRWLTFISIGMLQALVVSLGNLFVISAYIVDKPQFVLFSILLSIVFMSIIYSLVFIFGNIGKGLAVIFLVLQFSSSGGTFPVSMTSPFFQRLNPYMPFTYGVSLLREATGGMIKEIVLSDIWHLVLFPVLFLLLSLILSRPLFRILSNKKQRLKKARILQ